MRFSELKHFGGNGLPYLADDEFTQRVAYEVSAGHQHDVACGDGVGEGFDESFLSVAELVGGQFGYECHSLAAFHDSHEGLDAA